MNDEWYYKRGASSFGPVTGVMLHELILRGKLRDEMLVRRGDSGEWMPVSQARASLPPVPEAAAPAPPEMPAEASDAPFEAGAQSGLPQSASASPPAYLGAVVMVLTLCWAGVIVDRLLRFVVDACRFAGTVAPASLLKAESFMGTESFATILESGQFVSLIVWQGCAFASLRRLYGEGMVRRSLASGLWWIVPFATFIMPLLCLRDMRYLSRKRRDCLDTSSSFGPLLITLEILVLAVIPYIVGMALTDDGQKISRLLPWLNLASHCYHIVLCVVTLMIVVGNFRQQRELYAFWQDDSHWKKVSED